MICGRHAGLIYSKLNNRAYYSILHLFPVNTPAGIPTCSGPYSDYRKQPHCLICSATFLEKVAVDLLPIRNVDLYLVCASQPQPGKRGRLSKGAKPTANGQKRRVLHKNPHRETCSESAIHTSTECSLTRVCISKMAGSENAAFTIRPIVVLDSDLLHLFTPQTVSTYTQQVTCVTSDSPIK